MASSSSAPADDDHQDNNNNNNQQDDPMVRSKKPCQIFYLYSVSLGIVLTSCAHVFVHVISYVRTSMTSKQQRLRFHPVVPS